MAQVAKKLKVVSIHKNDPFRFCCDQISYLSFNEMKRVAADAGICVDTMYRWWRGEVQSPHLRTVKGVIEALGYKLVVK